MSTWCNHTIPFAPQETGQNGAVIAVNASGAEDSGHWDELWACAVPDIHLRRLGGLGFNPAAPDAVLIRLLERRGDILNFLRRTNLPPSVVDAALGHPRWEVRGHLLEEPQVRALNAG